MTLWGQAAEVKDGDVSSYNNGYSIASFMGRFNWSEPTSRLPPSICVPMVLPNWEEIRGFFPFLHHGMGMKEESWLKNVEFGSNLKLRTGIV